MRLLTGLLILLLSLSIPTVAHQRPPIIEPPMVLLLMPDGGTDNSPFCSGTWIAPHRVLTNAHCVTEPDRVRVRYLGEMSEVTLVAVHVQDDLALLFVADLNGPAVPLARWVDHGEPVAVTGWYTFTHLFTRFLAVANVRGTVTTPQGQASHVILDHGFLPGLSGSAVVNGKGELVTIVKGTGHGVYLTLGVGADRGALTRFLHEHLPALLP